MPETRDDSQLTLLTEISGLGDSILPFFVSKNKTLEKKRLADFEMNEGHNYKRRTTPETFTT
jgi:hypothetical protein